MRKTRRPFPTYIGTVDEEIAFLKHEHPEIFIESERETQIKRKSLNSNSQRIAFNLIKTAIQKSSLGTKLQKMLLDRDLRRVKLLESDLMRFAILSERDLMKQSDLCGNCGHTLMMHISACFVPTCKCAAFVPKEEKRAPQNANPQNSTFNSKSDSRKEK